MEEEILTMWKSGLSITKVAEIYRRDYNRHIDLVRMDMHNRHAGNKINNYQALSIVEKTIYNYVMKERKK